MSKFDEIQSGRLVLEQIEADRSIYWLSKRLFDVVVSWALVPLFLIMCGVLAIANWFGNPGPLFFWQVRMGLSGVPFWTLKFRSMCVDQAADRGPEDPLEHDRISRMGRMLRKSRVDELPQILNVLRGEMSLIGPRPDQYSHAVAYCQTVPGYEERHQVRPGISGLAQVEVGYVAGSDATARKVERDLYYVRNAGFFLDTLLVFKTIATVFGLRGM